MTLIRGGYWAPEWGGIAGAEGLCGFRMQWERIYFGNAESMAAGNSIGVMQSHQLGRVAFASLHPPGGNDTAAGVAYEKALAEGKHDDVMQIHLQELDAFETAHPGRTVFTWHHEPTIGGPEGQASFMGAWDRWAEALGRLGLGSIKLLPMFTAEQINNGNARTVWRDYFDGIGVDGYNWFGSSWHEGPWRNPTTIFAGANTLSNDVGSPVYQIETGCAEDPDNPNAKADWIHELGDLADVWGWESLGWFQSPPNHGDGRIFRIDSSPQALDAFKEVWGTR